MFEPAMMPKAILPIFREILGTGSGVGMALVCSLCAMYVASGIGGYAFPLYVMWRILCQILMLLLYNPRWSLNKVLLYD